ncbi:MAG: hypothetical protein NTU54_08770, partial [Candidatus Omnitrophica bacterium]|nr:hypothetical protein [Candidatus Omnitrophota bacterium]
GAGAGVGTYSIVPSSAVGSGLSNYAITYINGSLTVNLTALAPVIQQGLLPGASSLQPLLPYLEQIQSYQINTYINITGRQNLGLALFYHPITSTDSSELNQFVIEEGAYDFIDNSLNLRGHQNLSPVFDEIKKKNKLNLLSPAIHGGLMNSPI